MRTAGKLLQDDSPGTQLVVLLRATLRYLIKMLLIRRPMQACLQTRLWYALDLTRPDPMLIMKIL
jgi:hypothetical protein